MGGFLVGILHHLGAVHVDGQDTVVLAGIRVPVGGHPLLPHVIGPCEGVVDLGPRVTTVEIAMIEIRLINGRGMAASRYGDELGKGGVTHVEHLVFGKTGTARHILANPYFHGPIGHRRAVLQGTEEEPVVRRTMVIGLGTLHEPLQCPSQREINGEARRPIRHGAGVIPPVIGIRVVVGVRFKEQRVRHHLPETWDSGHGPHDPKCCNGLVHAHWFRCHGTLKRTRLHPELSGSTRSYIRIIPPSPWIKAPVDSHSSGSDARPVDRSSS